MSPLKRRSELHALSEDHHNALVIALRCRRLASGQYDAEPAEFWAGVQVFMQQWIGLCIGPAHLGVSDLPIRFVFPNAPSIPVTINGGYVMPA